MWLLLRLFTAFLLLGGAMRAGPGVLSIVARDTGGRGVPYIQIAVDVSSVGRTDVSGIAHVTLTSARAPGERVDLRLVTKTYFLVSPWDGQYVVPALGEAIHVTVCEVKGVISDAAALFAAVMRIVDEISRLGPKPTDAQIRGILDNFAALFGARASDLLRSMESLTPTNTYERGVLELHKKNYPLAQKLLEQALADVSKQVERGTKARADLVNVAIFLGHAYYMAGEYHQAAQAFRKAESLSGSDSRILTMLGVTSKSMRDYSAAETYLLRALKNEEKVSGPESAETAKIFRQLGNMFEDKGDLDRAAEYFRRALRIYERTSVSGPELALASNGLIASLYNSGNYEALIPLLKHLLKRTKSKAETAEMTRLLGRAYFRVGDKDKALAAFRQSVRMMDEIHPAGDLSTVRAICDIAEILKLKGDYAGAQREYRAALNRLEGSLGSESGELVPILSSLAALSDLKGDSQGSLPYYQWILRIRERTPGTSNHGTALFNVGLTLFELRRWVDAERYLRQALPLLVKHLGPSDSHVEIARQKLVELKSKQPLTKNKFPVGP